MNLTENQRLAEQVDQSYIDLESALMQNIARHLSDYKQPIDSDDWLLKKMAEIGQLNKENIKLIAKMAGVSNTAAERMLNEAAEKTLKEVEPAFDKVVKKKLAEKAVKPAKSKNMRSALKALFDQAKEVTNRTNTVMMYKARDAYSNLVKSIASRANEISNKQSFLDVIGKHATEVTVGPASRQQAMRSCIAEFNKKGIPAFVDKAGREWTPEAYVNMVMRNTARQTAEEVQSARCRDHGINLIAIDSHSGARPKCAKDQGKIFDLNNGSGETEDVHGRKIRYYPWNSSSYGEPDGILGINCGHHKHPFIPGVSIQRYFPTDDYDANNKLYRQTQVQRALERDVRKRKRECMLYKELGDEEHFKEAAVELKKSEEVLKGYVSRHENLVRRKNREEVVGFDKKLSGKAVAISKYVEKYSGYRYNEKGNIIVTDDRTKNKKQTIPKQYRPFAVMDTKTKNGTVNRTIYDSEGMMIKQINPSNHGNPKEHSWGQNGEHVHDVIWENGKIVSRPPRELTEKERKEHSDII